MKSHTRRHFERAIDDDPVAQQALELIGALYEVEKAIRTRELTGQTKLDYRSRYALPVVDEVDPVPWTKTKAV